ncbi:hypothetical protein EV360DRAFT_69502 [Lentinula raphanica]|nr:hypothetical protein EV360DRAFT_69502 [Lentinula raphanica]
MPVSEGHLEALFSFLFYIGWKDDAKQSTEEFILLGEISQQYIIPDALNYTINNLGYRSYDFEKAQKLYYACKFGVPDWGESAMKDILRAYAGVEKTVGDIHLHSNIMTILYAGQSNIRYYIRLLANNIPDLDSNPVWAHCPQKSRCEKSLQKGWQTAIKPDLSLINHGGIQQVYFHIRRVLKGDPTFDLTPHPAFKGMTDKCCEVFLHQVEEVVNRIDKFIVDEAGARVKKWIQTDSAAVHN